jgi:transposase-like protein
MMPRHNRPITQLAQEEGIPPATLYNWRNQARRAGQLSPDANFTLEGWTSRDKFAAVLETTALNEAQLTEYCRKKDFLLSKSSISERLANKLMISKQTVRPTSSLNWKS